MAARVANANANIDVGGGGGGHHGGQGGGALSGESSGGRCERELTGRVEDVASNSRCLELLDSSVDVGGR